MFIKLAPQQLGDPGKDPRAAAFKLAVVAVQCCVQALAGGQHACCKVGRKLAGAGFGGQVAFVLVIVDLLVGKLRQALMSLIFACRPQCSQ